MPLPRFPRLTGVRHRRCLAGLAAALLLAAAPRPALGQDEPPPGPLVGPPIQQIATASALSTEPLGSITSVRELPDGRVLVNDGTRRRLLLMDSTLALVGVVLDSLSEVANTYGPRPGALIPFRADSTLFVDPASYAVVVLDPEGRITGVRSVWRVEHVTYFTSASGLYGWPGLDAAGRIVYRIPARAAPPAAPPPAGVPYFPPPPDSAFVVAVDLETRDLDTLGVLRIPRTDMRVLRTPQGGFTIQPVVNPLPSTDDWAVLPDGTVAFVRALDYRIDYLGPDQSWSSSEKLPYEWQRLTDEDRWRIVDSVTAVQERSAESAYATGVIRWVNLYGRGFPEGFAVPEGYVPPMGFPRDWILPAGVSFPANYVYACPPGVEPTPMAAAMAFLAAPGAPPAPGGDGAPPGPPPCLAAPVTTAGGAPPPPTRRSVGVMPPSELPDYRPPIPTASVRADLDGNLWIRTHQPRPVPGGPVYDIVSREGELVSRFQLPQGYLLAGFGRDRVVYLTMRDATGVHLARVRLR